MMHEGYFFFVDRLKRMINVSGLKVWPAEVEAILHGHAEDQRGLHRRTSRTRAQARPCGPSMVARGEVSGRRSTRHRSKRGAAQNMAAYKVPKVFEFRESLPRSVAGKVLWKEL